MFKTKPFRNKNLNLFPNGKPYFEKTNRARRIYAKPQSAKRPDGISNKNKQLYKQELVKQPYQTYGSRNTPKEINSQNSNPVKTSK